MLEYTAPAENDEITIVPSREIDDSRASLALSEHETDVDPVGCVPDSAQPIEELLRPCGPPVLRLVDIARGDQCPRLSGPLGTGRSDVKHHEFGCGL
jgi:hypothetical protein